MARNSKAAARARRRRIVLRNRVIFGLLLVTLVVLIAIGIRRGAAWFMAQQQEKTGAAASSTASSAASSQSLLESDERSEGGTHLEGEQEYYSDAADWRLILVNNNVAVPQDYAVETLMADTQTGKLLQTEAAEQYQAMAQAARVGGVSLMLCSGYRSVEYQQELFDREVAEWQAKGYSEEDALAKAGTIVAVPGHSEHNTGLAADIVTPEYQSLDEGFAETEAFAWLQQHCAEYGFILRYPENKTAITGIIYEPWHYRYVGVEAATAITQGGLCLEEYLAKADVAAHNAAQS